MEFFYQGNSITKCEFLSTYEPMYYNDCTNKNKLLSQRSSRFIENRIDDILLYGITKDDLKLVIAWKIGAISHRKSEDEQDYKYSSNFDKTLNWALNGVDAKPVVEFLMNNWSEMLSLSDEPYKLYEKLLKQNFRGFRHVYIITLLYFFTKGKCPIYDQYACRASIAIKEGKRPGENIKYTALSRDIDKSWCEYMVFQNRLKDLFGDDYYKRTVDRSIFVYGHLFANGEKTKC